MYFEKFNNSCLNFIFQLGEEGFFHLNFEEGFVKLNSFKSGLDFVFFLFILHLKNLKIYELNTFEEIFSFSKLIYLSSNSLEEKICWNSPDYLIFMVFLIFILIGLVLIFQLNFCILNIFSKKYLRLSIFIFFAILLNFSILLFDNLVLILFSLVFISCYSFYLVLKDGYGVGLEVLTVLLFKILADLIIMVCLGSGLNMGESFLNQEILDFWSDHISSFKNSLILIPFLIYSLFGVFGFWLYWAMDASHFVSIYLHSVGFISIGVIILGRIFYFGGLEIEGSLLNIILIFSFVSFFFFLLSGVFIKDLKKSYGYFSSSSISLLIYYVLISPTLCFFYIILSSIIKVFSFTIIGYCGKKAGKGLEINGLYKRTWLIFLIVFLEICLYCVESFFIFSYFKNPSIGEVVSNLFFLLFSIKLVYLVIFFNRLITQHIFLTNSFYSDLNTSFYLFIIFFVFFSTFYKFFPLYLFKSYIKFHLYYFCLLLILMVFLFPNWMETKIIFLDSFLKYVIRVFLYKLITYYYFLFNFASTFKIEWGSFFPVFKKSLSYKLEMGDLLFIIFLFFIFLLIFITF